MQYVRESEVIEILSTANGLPGSPCGGRDSGRWLSGDYYVAAMPLERIAPLINERMLATDPALGNLSSWRQMSSG